MRPILKLAELVKSVRYRILLVEDDPLGGAKMCHLLETMGQQVVAVERTGEGAWRAVQQLEVDVVIMDIILEGEMDGIASARAIREVRDVPIIFLTGVDNDEQIQSAIEAYSGAYLLKPPAPRELQISLDMVVYRHRTERELREREARLAVILRQSQQAIVHYTCGSGINFINPEGERLLGQSGKDLWGRDPAEILHLRRLETGELVPLTAIVAGRLEEEQALHLDNPGQLRAAVRVTHSWVPGQEGEAAILTLDDVTDRLATQQRLRLLASSIENLSEGLLVAREGKRGAGYVVEYANPAFNRWVGRQTPVVGELLHEVLDPAGESPLTMALTREVRAEERETFELSLVVPLPEREVRLVEVTLQPVAAEPGRMRHLIGTVRDVTQLRRLEANTRQSQKLEAIGRLADGLAHDFNNIIAIITGLSELLLQTTEADSAVNRRVRQILETSRRGADIISQLMAFSRREQEQTHHLELGPVLEQFVPLIHHLMPEGLKLELAAIPELPPVVVNKTHVEQLLLNLCTNARDAIGDAAGHILIAVRQTDLDESTSAVSQLSATPGPYVELRVQDSGSGIPPEILHSIFDPFFTTKDIGKGTGLGLSTVYGILQKNRGGLRVESHLGEGTTFFLYLPIIAEPTIPEVSTGGPMELAPPPPPRPDTPPEAEDAPAKLRVAIRERDPTLAHAIKSGLESRGWMAQRLHLALDDALAQGRWHQFDALVLPATWATPGLFDGLREAQTHNPWLHLFILAERGHTPTVPGDLRDSVSTVLKPLALNDFFALVEERTAEQGSPVPAA